MLASLLPGLRDLRTPLACGYVWMAAIWIGIGYPTSLASTPHWLSPVNPALYDLAHVLKAPVLLAILSFAAYLLGAMFEFDVMRVQRDAPFRPKPLPAWVPLPAPLVRRYLRIAGYNGVSIASLQALVIRIRAEFVIQKDAWVPARREGTLAHLETVLRTVSRDPVERRGRIHDVARAVLVSGTENELQDRAVWLVTRATLLEIPTVATRLQLTAEKVYDRYDRLASEANFRANLAVPLAALVVVVAVRFGTWWLLGVALPVVLGAQGSIKTRRPGDLLLDAVAAEDVRSMVLDRSIQAVADRNGPRRRVRRHRSQSADRAR